MLPSRLRINRRRQVGEGESPTCFESGRRILRPVFGQIGGKLVVSDVLRPILAHVRSKYSNTQPWTCNLEPQADKPRPRVVPLSQPQISKLLKTTCPVQCGPRVLVHFLRRQDFLDRAVAKCLRILIQTKKGKFAKNTTNSWYKEARGELAHSRGQFSFKMFPSSQRAVAGPQIWRLPA